MQPLQHFVDSQEFVVRGRDGRFETFERPPFGRRRRAADCGATPRVVDQQAAHRLGGGGEEMTPAVQCWT